VLQFGVDVHLAVAPCQFKGALACVVVGVIAVVVGIDGGMHAVVDSPEQMPAAEPEAVVLCRIALSEVSGPVPLQVVQSLILRILDSSGRMRLVGVAIANARFLVALLIAFGCFQRYSPPLTGCIAGENKGVKPHLFRAVYPFGFMCYLVQEYAVYILFTLRQSPALFSV